MPAKQTVLESHWRLSPQVWERTACGLFSRNAVCIALCMNDNMSQAIKRHHVDAHMGDRFFRESTDLLVDMCFVVVFGAELAVRMFVLWMPNPPRRLRGEAEHG